MKPLRLPNPILRLVSVVLATVMAIPEPLVHGQAATNLYPVVIQHTVNNGSTQRSVVTNLALTFNTNVSLVVSNLVLRNLATNVPIHPTNFALAYDTVSNKATWTFPGLPGGTLPDGNYIAALRANTVSNAAGHRLDGNADGRLGDPHVFDFFRYFADWNGDRDVDFLDNHWFQKSRETDTPIPLRSIFDDNGRGPLDPATLAHFRTNYFTILPPQTCVFADLVNDTGLSAWDGYTADPTIAGGVVQTGIVTRFECRFDGNATFFDTTADLGNFWFDATRLALINGFPLPDGPHTLHCRTLDSSARYSQFSLPFILDRAAPDTTITSHPPHPSSNTLAAFTFTGTDVLTPTDQLRYECRHAYTNQQSGVSNAPSFVTAWFPCQSPNTLSNLSEGWHTFEVRAIDLAGNVDLTPASFTWFVDLTPPDTFIVRRPPRITNSPIADFEFTNNEPGAVFQCRLINPLGMTSAWVNCSSLQTLTNVSEGTNTLQVRSCDLAGNCGPSDSWIWLADYTPPPAQFANACPPEYSNIETEIFDFFGTDNFTPPNRLVFQCRHYLLPDPDPATTNWSFCTSPITLANLVNGKHVFEVRAIDEAGNVDPTPAMCMWTVDGLAPTLTLRLDPAYDTPPDTNDLRTTLSTVTLIGQTEPGLLVTLSNCTPTLGSPLPSDGRGVRGEGIFLGTATADTNGAYAFTNVMLELGTNLFKAWAIDLASNRASASLTVILENLCPFVASEWQTAISNSQSSILSSPSSGTPGSVAFDQGNCAIVLTEGGSFQVALDRTFTIPAGAGLLCLTYTVPAFDTTAVGLMRDAFEVALVDASGRPLTYTIQGSAGILPASAATPPVLPPSPDALFNHSDGQAHFVAPGAALRSSISNAQSQTLFIDTAHLAFGSAARLILRLVNNDLDRTTTVRITDVRFKPSDLALNLSGSPGTALSLILGGGAGGTSSGASTNPFCPPGATGSRLAGLTASTATFPTNFFGGNLIGPETTNGDSVLPPDGRLTFTTTAEFQRGTLFNLTAINVLDELRLSSNRTTFPVMWIPNAGEDTVSKIDTQTGRETARYRTWFGPAGQPGYFNHLNNSQAGAAPSRTAVDRDGNVYVANRHFDNRPADVIKILAFGGIDRNSNGVIDTSFDANTNWVIDVGEMLLMGDTNGNGRIDPGEISDERIAWVASVGPAGGVGRALTLDRDGNIWLGLYQSMTYYKLSPDDGHVLAGPINVSPHTPYGAVVDGQGMLWSINNGTSLLKLDTVRLTNVIYSLGSYLTTAYGISVGNNRVYLGAYQGGCTFLEFNPITATGRSPAQSCFSSLHSAVDMDGNLFAGAYTAGGCTKFRPDGSVIWAVPKQAGTGEVRGTVVDSDNNVWQIHRDTSNISKFRGTDGVPLGVFPVGNQPYIYTDATGLSTFTTTSPSGTWTEIVDSSGLGTVWGAVGIGATTPPQTSTRIRVRASDSRSALLAAAYIEVVSGQALPDIRGRFLQAEVALRSDLPTSTPSVQDITVLAVPPPSLTTDAPGVVFAPGATILISGRAIAAQPSLPSGAIVQNSITTVSLNGAPADAFDPAGNYYRAVQILPGLNTFIATATDLFGQTTTNTLTIQGACPDNASNLEVVSASVQPGYGRTSFNEWTKVLYADLALRNAGTYPIRAPFYVGVTRISDPSVSLLSPDGVTADGIPYYDFTATLLTGSLNTGALSAPRALAFHNPNKVQFTYDLVVLGQLNQPPYFTTAPPLEAIVGKPYAYTFDATDPDGNTLIYSLLSAPTGMVLNASLTTLNFQPSTSQIGNHDITLRASDGKGGIAEQHYLLNVINPPSNRPPFFISTPITVANVSTNLPSPLEPADLRDWTVLQFPEPLGISTPGVWAISPDGLSVTQHVNANPTMLVSDFDLTNNTVEGTWRVISGGEGDDDDFVGFVFGYQDTNHFYLFDWKRGDQTSDQGFFAQRGMSVKIVHAMSPLVDADLWPTAGSPGRVTTIYHNAIAWAHNTDYAFRLDFRPGEFIVTVRQGTNTLATIPLSDNTYTGGKFGFYNDSQGNVRYAGFAKATLATPTYAYDADANDPDGDPLTYSLLVAPTNMTINPVTGLIRWGPTADQIGLHNVTVLVQDGRGGSNTQSYAICVLPAEGNRAPLVRSQPITPLILSQPVGGGELVSLRDWSVFQFAGTGNFPINDPSTPVAQWQFDPNFTNATQVVNGQPSILLSDFQVSDDEIKGRWFVNANNDDDFIGFVFGYQDPQHFYVLDWKALDQLDTRGFTPRGFCLKAFTAADPLQINDLWTRTNIPGRRAVLYLNTNAPGWAYQTPYDFTLEYHPTTITVSVQGPGVSVQFTVPHTNYAAGNFGFYNYSQNNVVYQGFTREVLPPSLYRYQIVAVDPDNDPVRYALLQGPAGMTVNSTNGLLTWSASTNNVGRTNILVRITDGRGGVTDHAFALDVIRPGSASIRGIVFNDLNRNGTRDGAPLEPGQTNWSVFFDQNGNGRRDDGERAAITDAAGAFTFSGLPSATYRAGVDLSPGWIQTAPSNFFRQITLTNGQTFIGADFGVFRPTNSPVNSDPIFVTVPPTDAVPANQTLLYYAAATDANADLLTFDLVVLPDGMLVETNTGAVAWRPLLSQLGVHDVILRVQDGRGGVALQSWQITVIAPNAPPFITSFPPGPAVVGFPYRYAVCAQDPESQPLTFSLGTNLPAGLSLTALSTNSAVLAWTPALNQLGTNRLEVIVRDPGGAEARQTIDLEVVSSAPNRPPTITSAPRTQTRVGSAYAYVIEVADPDGDPVAVNLVSGPAGMVMTDSQGLGFDQRLLYWPVSEFGSHVVRLRATDSRSGTNEQQFTLNVSSSLSNQPPFITSNPLEHATTGQTYDYQLEALDPDDDAVTWRLVSGPVGMSLDPESGRLLWNPTLDQLGTNAVIIEAIDVLMATASQAFNIDVGCVNRPPQITSVPPTAAQTGEPYLYAPRGSDPDGDRLSWSLVPGQFPVGMTIDGTNGLVRWTPTTNQTGNFLVSVKLSDGRGGNDTQTFTLYSSNLRANRAPIIVTTPARGATIGRPYAYTLRATDADGDTLTLQSLLPLPAGASFAASAASQAVLMWTPTPAQIGQQEFILSARDPAGASAAQRFFVTVRANDPPVITSIAPASAIPAVTYRYDVRATDPNGDALAYALTQAPAGMMIDALGRISWSPASAQAGSNAVALTVSDGFGGIAVQSYIVTVATDTQPPVVSLELVQGLVNTDSGQWAGNLGSTIRIRVNATDNVGISSLALRVGTQIIPLGSDGSGSLTVTETGLFDVVGTAVDLANNTNSANRPIQFRDPRATNTILVRILSPTNSATITAPVPVVATITNLFDLTSYRVELAPADLVDLNNLSAPNAAFTTLTNATLPPGTRSLIGVTLATLDPTTLKNDSYVIRVYAGDVNGSGWYEPALVGVSGNLKFGEFRLEFTDLAVPVAGIPITVSRVYDTRDAGRLGDFGHGWTLGAQGAQIRETLHDGTLYNGSRVYLNTPDGRRVGFTAYPANVVAFGFVFADVTFRPDPGVFEKLEINGGNQVLVLNGDFLSGLGGDVFNPNSYRLTTKDGTAYDYDQNLGLQRVADLNGNRLVFTRDGIFHYSAGSATPDQQVPFIRDAQGRITQLLAPDGSQVRYAYDFAGNLSAFTDASTNTTQYRYSLARAHYLTNIIDSFGRSALRMDYDANGRLVSVTDAQGHRLDQDFDLNSRIATFKDGNGNTILSQFDENGNELVRGMVGVTTNFFTYDANNNLLASTNGRGFATNYTYDARGNVTSISDSLGNRTTVAYNAQGKPVGVTNALGQILNLRYDGVGKLLEVVNNAGLKTIVTRDSQGRVASLTDAAGHTTTFDYTGGCACGKPGKVINPDGSFKLSEYDSLGNTTRTVNELGAETLSSYDSTGKLLWMRDPLTNYTQFFYHGPLLTNVLDALGRSTRYEYDSLNRTNAILDAQGGVVRFEYDANGNRTKVIDAVTNVTTFVYDAANRLVQQIDPLGQTNFFAYDAAGNRTEVIDRNGRRRTFAYDALNRMTNELWWEGASVVRSIVFGFNELGVQTLAADPAARYEYRYDSLNRLERALAQSAGVPDFTLLYSYTALGQVESVTDSYGVRVGSGYDNRNRLAQRTWQGAGVDQARVDFAYDVSGNRVRTDRFADLAGTNRIGFTMNAYNRAGIVTNITHLGPASQVLAKYDYNFDAAYQITRWAIGNQLSDFAYDRTGQLTNALNTAQPDENFRFDANGNRVGAQSGGSYVVGGNNQVLSDGTNRYAYDAEGNMTSRSNTVTTVLTTYQFDHRNRLENVLDRNPGGVVTQTVAFVYDAMNRRLGKTVNGPQNTNVVRFLYNQDDSWADLDGSNAVTARYLHGARIDELLARQRAGDGRGWYLTDHLGTVRDLANAAGAVVRHVDYSSFGQVLGVNNPAAVDRFLFTGREFDGETGLYFYRARYYSAPIGRFVSEDPLRLTAGLNCHAYVGNVPLAYGDAFGLSPYVEYLDRVRLLFSSSAVKGQLAGVPTKEEAFGALLGWVHGFSLVNLIAVAEVIGTGDLSLAYANTKTRAEAIASAYWLPSHFSGGLVGAYAGGIDVPFTPGFTVNFLPFFRFTGSITDIEAFGERLNYGGLPNGVSAGLAWLRANGIH